MKESSPSSSEGPPLIGRSFPSPTNGTLGPAIGPMWYWKHVLICSNVSVITVQCVISVRSTKEYKCDGREAN